MQKVIKNYRKALRREFQGWLSNNWNELELHEMERGVSRFHSPTRLSDDPERFFRNHRDFLHHLLHPKDAADQESLRTTLNWVIEVPSALPPT